MIGWILKLLLFLIVIRLVWRFIAGVMDGMDPAPRQKAGQKNPKKSVPLVKDPVCGTYVVRDRALTLDAGTQTQYFCSETCRDEYARRGYGPRPLREAK
jgi:YHS domain-containing protein